MSSAFIKIRKVPKDEKVNVGRGMWQATCYHKDCEFLGGLNKQWQYWAFGATLGSVQEHIRRKHGARSSAPVR